VGTDPDKIMAAAQEILAGRSKVGRIPRLWDGKAAERIVKVLLASVPCREKKIFAT
jgi:UDP-N-acetylglucosamine 2-epimerase (non-hydrolysing)